MVDVVKIDPVGGQALIEGVMMRSARRTAMSCRKQDGSIVTRIVNKQPLNKSLPWSLPIVRGAVTMVEMLMLGYDALSWSANQQLEEEEQMSSRDVVLTLCVALVATIGVFVVIPYFLTFLFTKNQGFIFTIIDGLIRIVLFLAYLIIIGRMAEVRTLYEYHGAEHKAVHCHEAGKKLTPKNVLTFPKEHPRCGTSFLLITLVVAIITFSLVSTSSTLLNILSRVVLLPVIAGISFEILKLSAKHQSSSLFKLIITPGLWLQKLTTREPNEKQAEVAIVALKKAL